MRTSPQDVQHSLWPPSSAVRHGSIALITWRSTHPRCPALIARQASPWRRKTSATSSPGDMAPPGQAGGTASSFRRPSGLAVRRIRPVETCV